MQESQATIIENHPKITVKYIKLHLQLQHTDKRESWYKSQALVIT